MAHFSGNVDQDTLDEFDELFGVTGGRSRSDALRELLDLGIAHKKALDRTGIEFDTPRDERMAVVSAISRMANEEWTERV